MNPLRRHHVGTHGIHQRTHHSRGLAEPAGQVGAVEFGTGAAADLDLTIQRKMVGEFCHGHVSSQSRCCQAALNGQAGSRGRRDGLASAAGQLWTHVTDDAGTGRRVVEYFSHILAERGQHAAAVRTRAGSGVLDNMTRKMRRQRSARRFVPGLVFVRRVGRSGRRLVEWRRLQFGNLRLNVVEGQLELVDRGAELFRRRAELLSQHAHETKLQLLMQQSQFNKTIAYRFQFSGRLLEWCYLLFMLCRMFHLALHQQATQRAASPSLWQLPPVRAFRGQSRVSVRRSTAVAVPPEPRFAPAPNP